MQLYAALISGVPIEYKPKQFLVDLCGSTIFDCWVLCTDKDFDIGYYDYRVKE